MLSYMFYEVRDLIKKEYKEEFALGGKQKGLLALFFIGVIITFAALFATFFYKYLWIVAVLGVVIAVISLIRASKIQKKYDNKKHIGKIEKGIKELGLNSTEKINKLRKEIEVINIKEEERAQKMMQMVGQVFRAVFWVPLAFLIGILFNNADSIAIDLDGIVALSVILLLTAIMLIGVLISIFPSLPYLFQPGRRERDRVLQYLLDMEYLLQEEKEILLIGK